MSWLTFLVALAHVGVGGMWLGAMAYSLTVLQPRILGLFGSAEQAEDAYRALAARQRWRVVGMIAVLALSGVGLVALAGERSTTWWLLIAAKTGLLLVASGLFWWVSWRGWPQRVFALPEELPPLRRRFRQVALLLAATVASAFVLGVAAVTIGR